MKNHNRGYESGTEAVDAAGWKKTDAVSRIASWVYPAKKPTQGRLRIGRKSPVSISRILRCGEIRQERKASL
jgi:hypothetical protein